MGLLSLCLVPDFLVDPVPLQGHDGPAYEGFFDARRSLIIQVIELLHGASMIQLIIKSLVVGGVLLPLRKMLGANDRILRSDSIKALDLNGIARTFLK